MGEKNYWCYYAHRSRDLVSPVCGIFNSGALKKTCYVLPDDEAMGYASSTNVINRPGVAGALLQTPLILINSVVVWQPKREDAQNDV